MGKIGETSGSEPMNIYVHSLESYFKLSPWSAKGLLIQSTSFLQGTSHLNAVLQHLWLDAQPWKFGHWTLRGRTLKQTHNLSNSFRMISQQTRLAINRQFLWDRVIKTTLTVEHQSNEEFSFKSNLLEIVNHPKMTSLADMIRTKPLQVKMIFSIY